MLETGSLLLSPLSLSLFVYCSLISSPSNNQYEWRRLCLFYTADRLPESLSCSFVAILTRIASRLIVLLLDVEASAGSTTSSSCFSLHSSHSARPTRCATYTHPTQRRSQCRTLWLQDFVALYKNGSEMSSTFQYWITNKNNCVWKIKCRKYAEGNVANRR